MAYPTAIHEASIAMLLINGNSLWQKFLIYNPISAGGIDKAGWRFYFWPMAKQAGTIQLTGTFDELCFYQMEGVYYVRRKSSLTGKRFKKDKAFAESRKSAARFAEGNRLASKVYRLIDMENRDYHLFCFLKRKSILLLKEGKSLPEAEVILTDYLVTFGALTAAKTEPVPGKTKVRSVLRLQPKKGYYPGFTTELVRRKKTPAFKEHFQPAVSLSFCSLPPPSGTVLLFL